MSYLREFRLERILERILATEKFKRVREHYGDIKVVWKKKYFGKGKRATGWVTFSPYWGFNPFIYLNARRKEEILSDEKLIEKVIVHECNHLLKGIRQGAFED